MTDPIDSTAEELDAEPVTSTEVLTVQAPALAVTPNVSATELVERLSVIRDAMQNAMEKDVDYGVIPGTDKPALLKPGAEKLGVLFQLDVQLDNAKTWGPGDHLTVESKATVYHAPSGARLGFGEGVCTTRERKYAKRRADRRCPTCEQAAIIKGKAEYGGGWVCFKKKGGCGAKFPDGAQEIESQQVGEIENPDLPDLWNTVTKMAEKRARVDAVLAVTGASALFSQDTEDDQAPSYDPRSAERPSSPGVVSPSQVRLVYELASGKFTAQQLLNLLLDVKGDPPVEVEEQAALGQISEVVKSLTAEQGDEAVKRIRKATA